MVFNFQKRGWPFFRVDTFAGFQVTLLSSLITDVPRDADNVVEDVHFREVLDKNEIAERSLLRDYEEFLCSQRLMMAKIEAEHEREPASR